MSIFGKNSGAETPEEMRRALADQADRLEEMDKAEGRFGEEILDEELDAVAGGEQGTPACLVSIPPTFVAPPTQGTPAPSTSYGSTTQARQIPPTLAQKLRGSGQNPSGN